MHAQTRVLSLNPSFAQAPIDSSLPEAPLPHEQVIVRASLREQNQQNPAQSQSKEEKRNNSSANSGSPGHIFWVEPAYKVDYNGKFQPLTPKEKFHEWAQGAYDPLGFGVTTPFETIDGERVTRQRGTPQGGVVSPILMNLFMHYTFDVWMKRTHPSCPLARYADDAVVHCRSQKQAEEVMQSIAMRLAECGLTMHPDKSKVVGRVGW